MEGNVVTAAKWLGASWVVSSLIVVAGMRWPLTCREPDRAIGPTPVQAGPKTPLADDLEELARSFRGAAAPEATTAGPTPSVPPRSFFDEPTNAAPPSSARD
jgi:hypothetical protein